MTLRKRSVFKKKKKPLSISCSLFFIHKTWGLLSVLPTNDKILGILKEFKETDTHWLSLLDGKNTFQLLYSLQIVDSLIGEEETAMVHAFFLSSPPFFFFF